MRLERICVQKMFYWIKLQRLTSIFPSWLTAPNKTLQKDVQLATKLPSSTQDILWQDKPRSQFCDRLNRLTDFPLRVS
jgi:hypothetical protein